MRCRVSVTVVVMLVAFTVLRWPCGPACAPDAHADRAPACHSDSTAIATLAEATHDCRDHAASPAVVSTALRLLDLIVAPPVVAPGAAPDLGIGAAAILTGRSHAPPVRTARSLQLRI